MATDLILTSPDPRALTPMQELQMQIVSTGDLEKLKQLREIEREWSADQAKQAFNAAFAAFKAEAVKLIRTKPITDGPLKGKKHVELGEVVRIATPALSQHGLSISWKLTRDEKEWMEVTCILRHIKGHSESVSMGGAPDAGPGRNAIQARGSAKTYLERYTATAILGLAPEDDNDGRGAPTEQTDYMEEGAAADFMSAIEAASSIAELSKEFRAAMLACGVPQRVLDEKGDLITAARFKREARAFADARQKMITQIRRKS